MKLKNTPLASLICVSLLGSAGLSQAEVMIADDFDSPTYAAFGLQGNNAGTGWGSNNWFITNVGITNGAAAGTGDSSARRNFAASLGATGIVWVRFDWGNSVAPTPNGSYGGLTFYTGNADTDANQNFLIGNPWTDDPAAGQWNISGGTGDPTTGISNVGMKSAVAKLDLGAGTVSLWVGAAGSTINVGGTADASVSGLNLTNLSGIRINGADFVNGNNIQSFDNLVIATTMADVNATSGTPYEIWANSFSPPIGLPAADDDNDGVKNEAEYAFGLLPNSGASVNPITSQLDKTTGKFSYSRRTASGLTYSVWFSENLADWTKDTGATEGTPVPSGANETVQVTLSSLPGNPLPAKLFIQVRAN